MVSPHTILSWRAGPLLPNAGCWLGCQFDASKARKYIPVTLLHMLFRVATISTHPMVSSGKGVSSTLDSCEVALIIASFMLDLSLILKRNDVIALSWTGAIIFCCGWFYVMLSAVKHDINIPILALVMFLCSAFFFFTCTSQVSLMFLAANLLGLMSALLLYVFFPSPRESINTTQKFLWMDYQVAAPLCWCLICLLSIAVCHFMRPSRVVPVSSLSYRMDSGGSWSSCTSNFSGSVLGRWEHADDHLTACLPFAFFATWNTTRPNHIPWVVMVQIENCIFDDGNIGILQRNRLNLLQKRMPVKLTSLPSQVQHDLEE